LGRIGPAHRSKGRRVRIVVDVPDFPPDRTKSHAVANYVRALIAYQTLRRELATVAVQVAHCKKMLANRTQAEALMMEAQALCEELGIEADISATTAAPR
jgi:hypothetical protein